MYRALPYARTSLPSFAIAFTLVLAGCATQPELAASSSSNAREEIYVLRSVREPQPSNAGWCTQERTGFAPLPADADRKFSFWSVQTQPSDGRIVNAKANLASSVRVCFGASAERAVSNFYGEGTIGGMPYIGTGDCRLVAADTPEKGLVLLRCVLSLKGLPAPYVGGMLVTSTIGSKAALGDETDPPGYTQSSIATIRLWKAR
jgi:hypothetical protein